jgi:hypothetical protein
VRGEQTRHRGDQQLSPNLDLAKRGYADRAENDTSGEISSR